MTAFVSQAKVRLEIKILTINPHWLKWTEKSDCYQLCANFSGSLWQEALEIFSPLSYFTMPHYGRQRVKVAFPSGPIVWTNDYFKSSPRKCKNGVLGYIVFQPLVSVYHLQHLHSPPVWPYSTAVTKSPLDTRETQLKGWPLTSASECQHQSRCRMHKLFLLHTHSTGRGGKTSRQ